MDKKMEKVMFCEEDNCDITQGARVDVTLAATLARQQDASVKCLHVWQITQLSCA